MPRVLLVEDHQDTRLMYSEFLTMSSYDVVAVPDGEQALAVLRVNPVDLVITDLSLPGMDGFELITTIRRDPALAEIPIICLSGYGGHSHEQRARAAGTSRIIQKPCMPDMLADVAAELIRDAAERRAKQ